MMPESLKIKMTGACAAAALVLVFSAAMKLSDTVVFSAKGLDLYNVKHITDANGRDAFIIDDLSYARRAFPAVNDLVLSFNGPSRSLNRDDAGLYQVRHASYESLNGEGVIGGGAAYFFKKEHGIEINTRKNLWLGTCTDLGSFTVELRLMPVSMKEGGVIFSNAGYVSGIKTGVELALKGGRVTARFHRVFQDMTGKRVDVFLNRGRRLQEGKWHHYSVSFDRNSGKLCTNLDGVEQETVYMTEEGEPFVNVYTPSFSCSDLPVVVIGKNYYGAIDEMRISYRHIEDLSKESDVAVKPHRPASLTGRIPVNSEGVITSPVGEFPLTGTKVSLLEWEEALKNNSFIWMEFRISDALFDSKADSPRWYRVTNRQRNIYLKKEGGQYLRGRYYQWRAHLIPSPDGSISPVLSGISLQYRLDPPPVPPLFLEAVRTGDATVTLRWKKNVEDDILGYRIYYGIQSGKYEGVIGTVGGKRIGNDYTSRGTWVEVEISNAVIDENRERDSGGVLAYPVLKNNVLYFFAVTGYDTYRPDTPYNHESPVSKEVTARPFPGSEITR